MHYVEAKGILSARNGMNLFRGCTHGCIYCDSRSKCYHMEHAFEDIEVKGNAVGLLEAALRRKRKKCMIGTGAMTDPYIPLEADLGLMRKVLSLILEPNVCTTKRRFEVLKEMRDAGIPTVVWLSPLLPFINDTEENISGILEMCREAKVYGIICFGMGLTLRDGNREYFYKQLDSLFPRLKEKYIQCYGFQYEIPSPRNDYLMDLFHRKCAEYGIIHDNDRIFGYLSCFEEKNSGEQLSLWDL